VAVIGAIIGLIMVKRENNYKKEIGFPQSKDYEMSLKNIIIFKILGFMAAFYSSCFGIPGGLVIPTIFNNLGIVPQAGSATAMYIMQYITLSHTIIGFIINTLPVDYAINTLFLTVVGTIPGLVAQRMLIAKYKK